ncbi:MAG: hypothetical protein K6T66_09035 [Peptococcaceae bacterium]|nr:hypothetical protein [Peptococcaceae bacterium]
MFYKISYTEHPANFYPSLHPLFTHLNAIDFLRAIGLERPRVAVLSPDLPGGVTLPPALDAERLKDMAARGEIEGADIDGPMDLGPAINAEEAEARGFCSPVAGKADLLVAPGIEAGNVLGKTIIHFAGGIMAGLVVGASRPVVLTSRAETPFGKLSSIAFACYYSIKKQPLQTAELRTQNSECDPAYAAFP